MKNFLSIVSLALLASGCATNITPVATGGSKADGTVVASYEFGAFQQPIVDWSSAQASAKERCKAWGYKKAIPFDGTRNVCVAYNGYGSCIRTQVNITYQCTNK